MAKPVSIFIQFAQSEYFIGDQVSGEIVLRVHEEIADVKGMELHAWSEETATWNEVIDAKSLKRSKVINLSKKKKKKASNGIMYYGGRLGYDAHKLVWEPQGGRISPGVFILPFTYYLPYNTGASTTFTSPGVSMSVKHFCHARLLPTSYKPKASGCNNEKNPSQTVIKPQSHMRMIAEERALYLGDGFAELCVIEKASHQATLRPYAYQCAYSIPHFVLGTGECSIVAGCDKSKPNLSRISHGDVTPFYCSSITWRLCQANHLQSHAMAAARGTQRHKTKCNGGPGVSADKSFKDTRQTGNVLFDFWASKPRSLPLHLPEIMAPTSHGSSVTSEWEISIACRYKGKVVFNKQTTGDDVTFPVTIWPATVHPARRGGIPTRLIRGNALIKLDEYGASVDDEDSSMVQASLPPPQFSLTSLGNCEWLRASFRGCKWIGAMLYYGLDDAQVLPTATFETAVDTGAPKASMVVRLRPAEKETGKENEKAPFTVYSGDECYQRPLVKQDLGLLMTPSLAKAIALVAGPPAEIKRKGRGKNQPPPRVKRAIAPLQS